MYRAGIGRASDSDTSIHSFSRAYLFSITTLKNPFLFGESQRLGSALNDCRATTPPQTNRSSVGALTKTGTLQSTAVQAATLARTLATVRIPRAVLILSRLASKVEVTRSSSRVAVRYSTLNNVSLQLQA